MYSVLSAGCQFAFGGGKTTQHSNSSDKRCFSFSLLLLKHVTACVANPHSCAHATLIFNASSYKFLLSSGDPGEIANCSSALRDISFEAENALL